MAHGSAAGEPSDIEFSVPSMICDGCVDNIRRALTALPGVQAVKPRLWRKRVRVRFDPSKVEDTQIRNALDRVGYSSTFIA